MDVRRHTELPDEILPIVAKGAEEGFHFVNRLIRDWRLGANRFDKPGEIFLCVYDGGRLVGFGGLNRDPYVDVRGTDRDSGTGAAVGGKAKGGDDTDRPGKVGKPAQGAETGGSVGRVRHVYVDPKYRSRGAGKKLVLCLLSHATDHFHRVRLRTQQAAGFYESLGFLKVTEDAATHVLEFTDNGFEFGP